jgi:hypothetical protein
MEDSSMEFHGGTAPALDAGDIGGHTVSLRPAIDLDKDQCNEARRLKRADPALSAADIASRLDEGATEGAVLLALAMLPTKNFRPARRSANVTLEAVDFLRVEQHERGRVWQTADRLIAELTQLRVIVRRCRPAARPGPDLADSGARQPWRKEPGGAAMAV